MLEQLIRDHLIFAKTTAKGWNHVKCKCCNDYQPRGAFLFESDKVVYNCFNCGVTGTQYEDARKLNDKFKRIMDEFGFDIDHMELQLARNFFSPEKGRAAPNGEIQKVKPIKEVELPAKSYIPEDGDPWGEVASAYLESRCIDPKELKWYLSEDPLYRDRIIIPFYKNGRLIYWQARSMDDENKKRYLNCTEEKDKIIYNVDAIHDNSPSALFVTEGIFDAIPLNGCSTIGSKIPVQKMEILNQGRRKKVFVIDKDLNGVSFAETALRNEYPITFISGDIGDVNKAIQRHGKLWTVTNLMSNVKSGLEAKLWVNMLAAKLKTRR